MRFISLLECRDLLWLGLLRSSVDPEWPTILCSPLAPFKSFKAMDHEGSPRLVHRDAHIVILEFLKECLIWTKHFFGSFTFLYDSIFNGFFEFIKRIFILQSLTERAINHLKDLGTFFSLRIISLLFFLCRLNSLLFAAFFLAFGWPLALLFISTGNVVVWV